MYKIFIAILISLFVSTQNAFCVDLNSAPKIKDFHTLTIRKGTFIKGFLDSEISSEYNKLNDDVFVNIPNDISLLSATVIPANSTIAGNIVKIEKAQQGRNGLFVIKFRRIIYPNGSQYKIKAHLYSIQEESMIGGEFTGRSETRKMVYKNQGLGAGAIRYMPDGPRRFGKETKLKAGQDLLIQIDEDINFIVPVE